MGNSSSSDRHQSSSAKATSQPRRPSSAASAKKDAGKDQLPPKQSMMKMTTAGRKTSPNTISPPVNAPTDEQGTDVPVTTDEPNLTAEDEMEEPNTVYGSINNNNKKDLAIVTMDSDDDEEEDEDNEDDDDEDDDASLDEYWAERQAVLSEAKMLSTVASWYKNSSQPVVSDGLATARCYFDRASAVPQSTPEQEQQMDEIMKDIAALKQSAGHFMHPERPVVVDSTACGRNYFDRVSAEPYEDIDDNEDAEELSNERDQIMKELSQLKIWAGYYAHPERPVTVDDPTCMGRNYFSRASAPDYDDDEEAKERESVMADMAQLKTWAGYYAHPERPVQVDATAAGRNYFTRPSAPEYDDEHDQDEKEMIMKEAAHLKQLAGWYMHPERPVQVDATAIGRNYFTRPSAPEYHDEEVEMDIVLREAAQLKQLAGWYMHPERPVECTDPCATGRNYFSRASAPTSEDENERERVLADAAELKKTAGWYMHPERPVECTDPCATGRNYFSRASAPTSEGEDERERVLADAAELKKVAGWYLHPEKPVETTDPCATGRNYFSRPSAPDYEDFEEEYQRDMVFADLEDLKKLAIDYRHPEIGVSSSVAVGRDFFSRPSAPHMESKEDAEEHARVLEDAAALKKLATDYLHPEVSMTTSVAVGRNFFARPSAPEYDDAQLTEEREHVLADAKKLKQVAGWYHHPEEQVKSSIAVTRNFFSRPSAAGSDLSPEEEEEKARILADAAALKKLAIDYMHPEKPVVSNVNCVRNYFNRPSAEGHADHIHTEGHAIDDHHHYHFDQHHNYHHDEDSSHFSHQSDHFEMEEDMFHEFRESLYAAHAVAEQSVPIIKEGEEGEEGKLSRSPSGVMLFDLDEH